MTRSRARELAALFATAANEALDRQIAWGSFDTFADMSPPAVFKRVSTPIKHSTDYDLSYHPTTTTGGTGSVFGVPVIIDKNMPSDRIYFVNTDFTLNSNSGGAPIGIITNITF
jgi:hypothetical protein